MWLLDTTTLRLKHFSDDRKAVEARYAILSHTWGEDEVTFQDMKRGSLLDDMKRRKAKKKAGFTKIEKACEQARRDQYQFVWVDTCCIDKDSSAELSEAINSMYRWYADAAVCYAYLADVSFSDRETSILRGDKYLESKFQPSRWFRRGWTLQELLTPAVVIFYDAHWTVIDTKANMARALFNVTGINTRLFRQRQLLNSFSIATRMSWAAHRETTRIEDEAYSLLGIFDVNMPMIYGEGRKAFLRLQEEIIKTSTDHSIFAWTPQQANSAQVSGRLLAPDARCFADAFDVERSKDDNFWDSYEISNSGLRISLPAIDDDKYLHATLNCHISGYSVTLRLKKYFPGGKSTTASMRRTVCEVDRSLQDLTPRLNENKDTEPSLLDILILRETSSVGVRVHFELAPNIAIKYSLPSVDSNHVDLVATELGVFRQGYVTVQLGLMNIPGPQERLDFGQFLQQQNAESTFRLSWARGFDAQSPDDPVYRTDQDLLYSPSSVSHQSWAQTMIGMPVGNLQSIQDHHLLARQHHYSKPDVGEYFVCFEAVASLRRKDRSESRNGAQSNGTSTDSGLLGLDDVFWNVQIRSVLWKSNRNGDCECYISA